MIKLDYFDLINDEPITIENVGSIRCPSLKDIKKISYFTYSSFVHCLALTPQIYFEELEKKGVKIDDETFLFTTKYDLLIMDNVLFLSVLRAFNFFFVENVVVNEKKYIDESVLEFHTIDEKNNIVGVINEDNYSSIVNVILQMLSVDVEKDDVEDLSKVKNYFEVASTALDEMFKQVSKNKFSSNGLMTKGIIVRCLVLPTKGNDTKKIINYLYKKYQDNIYLSIMNQYTPVTTNTSFPFLNSKVSEEEYDDIINYALDLGVKNAYIQEGDTSDESFIPPFDLEGL